MYNYNQELSKFGVGDTVYARYITGLERGFVKDYEYYSSNGYYYSISRDGPNGEQTHEEWESWFKPCRMVLTEKVKK